MSDQNFGTVSRFKKYDRCTKLAIPLKWNLELKEYYKFVFITALRNAMFSVKGIYEWPDYIFNGKCVQNPKKIAYNL